MSIKFTVPGKAYGKQRPRFNTYTGRAYTPQNTINYENMVRCSYLKVTNDKLVGCAIKIEIWAYFEPTKTEKKSKKKYNDLLGTEYTKKPDIDNVAKAILDGLNGIAYQDDNQISELIVHKIYSEVARTEIEISKFI